MANAVVIVDADADGKLDLAVANGDPGSAGVLFGRGDGTFSRPTEFATGRFPVALAAADIAGDSATDLAVANRSSHDVAVIRKPGDELPDPAAVLTLGKHEPTTPIDQTTCSTGTDTTVGIQMASLDGGAGLTVNRSVSQSESTTIPSWSWESRADPASRSFRWLFSARTPCDARPGGSHGGRSTFSDGDGVSVKRPPETSLGAIQTSAYGRWDARVAAPGETPAYRPLSSAEGRLRFRLSSPITLIDSHCTQDGQFDCEPPAGWSQSVLNAQSHDYGLDPSVVNPCPDDELRTCAPVLRPELFRCSKWETKAGRSPECVQLGAELKIGRGDAANGYARRRGSSVASRSPRRSPTLPGCR